MIVKSSKCSIRNRKIVGNLNISNVGNKKKTK